MRDHGWRMLRLGLGMRSLIISVCIGGSMLGASPTEWASMSGPMGSFMRASGRVGSRMGRECGGERRGIRI